MHGGAREDGPGDGDAWDPYVDEDTDAPPSWFAGQHLPADARRVGLTHHVPEGALLDFAGRLDASKKGHLVAAWLMLVVFGLPVVFAVMRLFQAF
jgi:hypothetical protein